MAVVLSVLDLPPSSLYFRYNTSRLSIYLINLSKITIKI